MIIDNLVPSLERYVPAPGGTRLLSAVLPTGTALAGETPGKPPPMPAGFENAFQLGDPPGMHTTDTIDYAYVASGEIWLELDDGAETLVRAGDFVTQDGTRHACTIAHLSRS